MDRNVYAVGHKLVCLCLVIVDTILETNVKFLNLVLQKGFKKDLAWVPLCDEGAQHLKESKTLVDVMIFSCGQKASG